MEDMESVIFQIILHGGNGRSSAMEAIHAAKQGSFDEAKTKLQEASEALNEAHKFQTALIQAEIRGEKTDTSLLMVHAQDHLMNAMTLKDLAAEFVDLYENIRLLRGVSS
ncbi:PTS system cellobiose-specific IIA component [Peribacillus deserti]|uniref:PTS system cellobiose-specific IIA component n=1 Tax=Peribacillus deserti TaxID=673318 RepID=A0ABS2QG28_9BACI|nr:PTS lactose/cellobiose transporter subunit IIA [Peribacillus deserti]MBM7692116.1 PTS system cellobiose-specific IIA component [Peribacillus deserti]